MFLSGCSSTRYVPDGEYLLKQTRVKRVKVEKTNQQISRKDRKKIKRTSKKDFRKVRSNFANLQRQQPNDRLLWVPLKLNLYSSVDIEKNNRWWSRTMQKVGEPPVVFDSLFADQTVHRMRQFLFNKGHFNPTIHYVVDTLRRPKKTNLVFHVNTGPGYHYQNVDIEVNDDSLTDLFGNWHSRTLIKSGQPYDLEILDTERLRITRRLQNLGYHSFDREHVVFDVDSGFDGHLLNIKMIINPPNPNQHHEKYTFDDIYIFPDERPWRSNEKLFDTTTYRLPKSRTDTTLLNYHFVHAKPLQIKPHIILSKLLIQPGDFYSLNSLDRTYENLLDLRVFRSTNITILPKPTDTNEPKYLLNTIIETQQAPRWTVEYNFDLTSSSSSGLSGAAANVALRNRNLFGGAEILSLQMRGLVEVLYLLNKNERVYQNADLVNNFDVGLNAGLDIPRFIAPFSLSKTSQHRPRTLINLGYSYQLRPSFYTRQIINTSFAYSWRQSRASHILFPLDINWVNISLKDDFKETIDKLAENNKRLEYQYNNHFIFSARYGFAFSGQQLNRPVSFNAFRFSVESSGNSLNLASRLLNAPKNTKDQYLFFNLAYAQYIRVDAELKRYWHLTDNNILVARLMGGNGYFYGNSEALPYEKGFFAGGNNNIRAWHMNQLGPGSYYDSNTKIERIGDIVLVGNIEYRFPIFGAFKGALFLDAGNIWQHQNSSSFPKGEFFWKKVPNDLAVGGGFGLRWDLNFFVIRLDAAAPLRDPSKPNGEKWVVKQMQPRNFVLNFGIGYPF
jgi:outer membrane protein assembly factor BamA